MAALLVDGVIEDEDVSEITVQQIFLPLCCLNTEGFFFAVSL